MTSTAPLALPAVLCRTPKLVFEPHKSDSGVCVSGEGSLRVTESSALDLLVQRTGAGEILRGPRRIAEDPRTFDTDRQYAGKEETNRPKQMTAAK